MKKVIVSTISLIISIIAIVSCNDKDYKPTYSSYVTTVAVAENGSSFYFVSDDSLKIYPASNNANYTPKTGDRLLIQYTLTDNASKEPFYVNLIHYYSIFTKGIITSTQIDTLGRDGSKPIGLWYSGGVYGAPLHINVDFVFMASNSDIIHSFHMNRDTIVENRIDQDGYYLVNFHHNSHNDYPIEAFEGLMSFPLTDEYTADGIKGLKIRFDNIADKDSTIYTLNY